MENKIKVIAYVLLYILTIILTITLTTNSIKYSGASHTKDSVVTHYKKLNDSLDIIIDSSNKAYNIIIDSIKSSKPPIVKKIIKNIIYADTTKDSIKSILKDSTDSVCYSSGENKAIAIKISDISNKVYTCSLSIEKCNNIINMNKDTSNIVINSKNDTIKDISMRNKRLTISNIVIAVTALVILVVSALK